MTSAFTMSLFTAETRPIVERLWQLYRHDLSEFRGRHGPEGFRGTLPDENGLYKLAGLLPFFDDDGERAAYVFYSDASPVGFAFVAGVTSEPRTISEFFVVRGARRQGIALAAVGELFVLHPGTWEIAFQENNVAAARFWRGVTAEAASDGVREERRPVPGKPEVPPDVWLTFSVT
jgi:predicted acetyltransferase